MRVKIGWLGACFAMLFAGLIACATSGTSGGSSESFPELSNVHVEKDGVSTVVVLGGISGVEYTAYPDEDFNLVVVELPSVRVGELESELSVYDGVVREVSVAPFTMRTGEPLARVEIALAEDAAFDVVSGDGGLNVRITPNSAAAATEDTDVAMDDGFGDSDFDELEGGAPAPAPVSEDAAPATALVDIQADGSGEGTVLYFQGDGSIAELETFVLDDPARLVVDLMGIRNSMTQNKLAVGTAHVSAVRVGVHPDKVRIVVDGGAAEAPFEGRWVVPTNDGLLVTLGAGSAVDTALASANSPQVSSAPVDDDWATTEDDGWETTEETAAPVEEDEWATEPAEEDEWATEPAADEAVLEEPMEEVVSDEEVVSADEEIAESDDMATDDAGWEEEEVVQEEAAFEETDEGWGDEEPVAEETSDEMAFEEEPVEEEIFDEETRVYGVSHERLEDVDRVVISVSQPVEYRVFKPNDETVMISLVGALISEEASGRITPDPGGPVAMVTTFQQPDVTTDEVRVVLTCAAGVDPIVAREGSMIFVDIPSGGVAGLPPAVAKDGKVAATESGAADIEVSEDQVEKGFEDISSEEILIEGGLDDRKKYVGRRISLDFKDAEISSIMRLIADVSNLNVIAGDDVQGTVTIRLVDIPWDQALDVVLATKGLGFVKVGNVVRIAPSDVLKAEEEARLQEARNRERLEDLVVKLIPINYGAAKDSQKLISKLLTNRGSVNIDKRTNTIIIKDIESVVNEATALARAVDTQTPQVMVEAKVVEANIDFSYSVGTVWAMNANNADTGSESFSEDFLLGDYNSDDITPASAIDATTSGVFFSNPITDLATGFLGFDALLLDQAIDLKFSLALAESTGDGKVISSPRVVTLDNTKAKVLQGVTIPYQIFDGGDATLAFSNAFLELEVTPHITSDRSVIMDLKISRNAPDDSVATPSGMPAIARNEAETEALVKDGQTLVLGGIYVITTSNRQTRTPYLYKIPILGALFKNVSYRDIRKELLVFVTPRIVRSPAVTG